MRCDEVFGNRQTFAVRVLDRSRNDFTLGVCHESSHTGDVSDLQPVSTSTRGDHAVDGVVSIGREVRLEVDRDFLVRLGPNSDELFVTLALGNESLFELGIDLGRELLVPRNDFTLRLRGDDVTQRDGHTGAGCPVESGVLHAVESRSNLDLRVILGENFHDGRDDGLVGNFGDIGVVRGEQLVEERLTECRLKCLTRCVTGWSFTLAEHDLGYTQFDECVDVDESAVESHEGFRNAPKRFAFAVSTGADGRHVVKTNDHVLRRNRDGASVGWLEDVVGCEHQHASFSLCFNREGEVDSHLVTVEVSVERCTDERVKLDCLTFNELWLERLDSQAVKGRCAVQQNGAVTNDFFELSPHLGVRTLNGALRALDR